MVSNNKLKEMHIKNCTYYFDDIINIKELDSKNVQAGKQKRNHIKVFLFTKPSNVVKSLYIIFNEKMDVLKIIKKKNSYG